MKEASFIYPAAWILCVWKVLFYDLQYYSSVPDGLHTGGVFIKHKCEDEQNAGESFMSGGKHFCLIISVQGITHTGESVMPLPYK